MAFKTGLTVYGSLPDKKAFSTNGEAPDQFLQPHVAAQGLCYKFYIFISSTKSLYCVGTDV